MRYLLRFICVLALGVMPLVGCSEEVPPECEIDEDCDDQNECTDELCRAGACERAPVYDGKQCDFDGSAAITPFEEDGVCVSGVCQENPCDDGNECTFDHYYTDGSCDNMPISFCEYGSCDVNGSLGVCSNGVCEEYPCNDGVICDDGDLCTFDWCECSPGYWNYGMCDFRPKCRGGQCRDASCDPADGSCQYTNKPDGTWCACPGVICIGSYSCQNGECV